MEKVAGNHYAHRDSQVEYRHRYRAFDQRAFSYFDDGVQEIGQRGGQEEKQNKILRYIDE